MFEVRLPSQKMAAGRKPGSTPSRPGSAVPFGSADNGGRSVSKPGVGGAPRSVAVVQPSLGLPERNSNPSERADSRLGGSKPSALSLREALQTPNQLDSGFPESSGRGDGSLRQAKYRSSSGSSTPETPGLSTSQISSGLKLKSSSSQRSITGSKLRSDASQSKESGKFGQVGPWKAQAPGLPNTGRRPTISITGGALRKLSMRRFSVAPPAMPGSARSSVATSAAGSRRGTLVAIPSGANTPRGSGAQSILASETRGSNVTAGLADRRKSVAKMSGRKTLLALPGMAGNSIAVPGATPSSLSGSAGATTLEEPDATTVTTLTLSEELLQTLEMENTEKTRNRRSVKKKRISEKRMAAFGMRGSVSRAPSRPVSRPASRPVSARISAESPTSASPRAPSRPVSGPSSRPVSPRASTRDGPRSEQPDEEHESSKELQEKSSPSSDSEAEEQKLKIDSLLPQAKTISKPKPKPHPPPEDWQGAGPSDETLHTLMRKLKAAAYTKGGVDWEKLFREVDKNNSGLIDYGEFLACIRKFAKIRRSIMSDKEVRQIFEYIDKDGSKEIDYRQEFIPWIHEEEFVGDDSDDDKDKEKSLVRGNSQDVMRMSVWRRPRDMAKLRAVFQSTRQQLTRYKEEASQNTDTEEGLKAHFQKVAGSVLHSFNKYNTTKALIEVWRDIKADDLAEELEEPAENEERQTWPVKGILTARLVAARGLGWFDPFPNPYVVLILGNTKFQTQTVSMTADPVWDQASQNRQFSFMVRPEEKHNVLLMKVYSEHPSSADPYLGFVEIPLPVYFGSFSWGEWISASLKIIRDPKETDPLAGPLVDNCITDRGEVDIQLKMDSETAFAEVKDKDLARKTLMRKTLQWGAEVMKETPPKRDLNQQRKTLNQQRKSRIEARKSRAPEFETLRRATVRNKRIRMETHRATVLQQVRQKFGVENQVREKFGIEAGTLGRRHNVEEKSQGMENSPSEPDPLSSSQADAPASQLNQVQPIAQANQASPSRLTILSPSASTQLQQGVPSASSTGVSPAKSLVGEAIAGQVDRLLERLQELRSCFEDRLEHVEQIDDAADDIAENANKLFNQMQLAPLPKRKKYREEDKANFLVSFDFDENDDQDDEEELVFAPHPTMMDEEEEEDEEDGEAWAEEDSENEIELDAEEAVALVTEDLKELASKRDQEVIRAQADIAEMRIAQAQLKELLNDAYPDIQGIDEIGEIVQDDDEMEILYGVRRYGLITEIESMKKIMRQMKSAPSGQMAASRKSVRVCTKTCAGANQTTFSFEIHGMKLVEDGDGAHHHKRRQSQHHKKGCAQHHHHHDKGIGKLHKGTTSVMQSKKSFKRHQSIHLKPTLQSLKLDSLQEGESETMNIKSVEWNCQPWELDNVMKRAGWPRSLAAPLQKLAMYRKRKVATNEIPPLQRRMPCGPVVTSGSEQSFATVCPGSASSSARGLKGTQSAARVRLTQFLSASTSSPSLLSWIAAGSPSAMDNASTEHLGLWDVGWSQTHMKRGISGWVFMEPVKDDDSRLGASHLSSTSLGTSTWSFAQDCLGSSLCLPSASVLNSPGPKHIHMKTAEELDEMEELESLMEQSALTYLSGVKLQRPRTGSSASLSSLVASPPGHRQLFTR